jgi:hypothetical protein
MHVAITRHPYVGKYACRNQPAIARRGLVSVSNEEVHWNSGTINIIDDWADIDVNHVEWHLTLASLV